GSSTRRSPASLLPSPEAHVQHLDEERERHREVDVALRHVVPHPLRHQHHPDEQQEGQREDLDARVPLDEAAHRPRRHQHHEHRQHHGDDHDRHLVGHADRGDHRVEREHDVEQEDLGQDQPEDGTRPGTRDLVVRPSLDLLVNLARRLVDEEQAAAQQDEVASRDVPVSHGDQRLGEPHDPRNREEKQDADAQGQGDAEPARELLLAHRQLRHQDRNEHDVVHAEDDLDDRERREREEGIDGEERRHREPILPGAHGGRNRRSVIDTLRRPPHHGRRMYTDEWLHLNGVWLHFQDWPAHAGHAGRAETVLLLHGLTQQSHAFDVVAPRLAGRYHCLALDLRGRGESGWAPGTYVIPQYVADVHALLDALELASVHVLGTSLGGLIGLTLARMTPDRLRSLALNDIGPEIDPRGAARVSEYAASVPERFPEVAAATEWALAQYPWLAKQSAEAVSDAIRWAVRRESDGGWRFKFDPAI